MNQPSINVAKLKNEDRQITIYWEESDKFLVHFEHFNEMEEVLIDMSFEAMVNTYKLMGVMIKDACLHDKDLRTRLARMSKSKIETNRI